MIAKLFNFLIVKTAAKTWNLMRRHPVVTWLLVILILLLPFLAPLAALWSMWLRLKAWYEDESGQATTAGRVMRRVIFYTLLLIVPGGFVLFALLEVAAWIWKEKARAGTDAGTLSIAPNPAATG